MKRIELPGGVYAPRVVAAWDYELYQKDPETVVVGPYLEIARDLFTKLGRLDMGVAAYARRVPQPRAIPESEWPCEDLVWLFELVEVDERAKNVLTYVLRKSVRAMQLEALVFLSEVWVVNTSDSATEAALRAHQRANNGSYEGFPGAQEEVAVMACTRRQVDFFYKAQIHRKGATQKPTLGPWEKRAEPVIKTGRIPTIFAYEEAPIYGA